MPERRIGRALRHIGEVGESDAIVGVELQIARRVQLIAVELRRLADGRVIILDALPDIGKIALVALLQLGLDVDLRHGMFLSILDLRMTLLRVSRLCSAATLV
jgi:hypothetical protein